MKFNRYVSLLVLFLIGTVALSGCSLFRSDFTTISPDELKIIVDDLPDQQKRILAQNEQSRKELIEQFRRACLLAQASEDEGLHKSDEFKKRTAIDEERLLAGEFSKRNLDFNISTDELNKYLDDNKAAFESDYPIISGDTGNKATEEEKRQTGLLWSEARIRGAKGREAGLLKDPLVSAKLKFRRANLLADLYANLLEERNKISAEEKAKYIEANPAADIDKLRTRAQALLERLKGGESFEKIADENNEDGTRGNGGDLNWVMKGMMDPDFEKAAFALRKGEISSELVKSRFGFHIIRVDDRRPVKPQANDPAKPTPTPTPAGPSAGPAELEEEIRVRHIFVLTQEADTFEQRLVEEKVKRAIEDATIKYEVAVPRDFAVQVTGFNPNSTKMRPGGGNSGTMRSGRSTENR